MRPSTNGGTKHDARTSQSWRRLTHFFRGSAERLRLISPDQSKLFKAGPLVTVTYDSSGTVDSFSYGLFGYRTTGLGNHGTRDYSPNGQVLRPWGKIMTQLKDLWIVERHWIWISLLSLSLMAFYISNVKGTLCIILLALSTL